MLKMQKPISLVNTCNATYCDRELTNAMLWYSEKPLQKSKKVFMYGRYPGVSIGMKKIHIHRLLVMYRLNAKDLGDNVVHHENKNQLDAREGNLKLQEISNHASLHNKGKVLTDNHKAKIAKKNRSRKGMRYPHRRKDICSNEIYLLRKNGSSFNQISIKLNLDWACVKKRYDDFIHDNPELLEVKP